MTTTLQELAEAHTDPETDQIDFQALGYALGEQTTISQTADLLHGLQQGMNADPEITRLRYAILRSELEIRGIDLSGLITGLQPEEGE